jgi:hypothetical protein
MLFVTGRKKLGVGTHGFQTLDLYLCIYRYDNYFMLLTRGDSSVDIKKGYGLDDRGIVVRFPTGAGDLSLFHCDHAGSRAHPASYPMVTGASFPGSKTAAV